MKKGTILFVIFFAKISSGQNYLENFKRYDIHAGFADAKSNIRNVAKDTLLPTTGGDNSSFGPCAGVAFNLPFVSFKESSIGTHIGGFFYIPSGGLALSFPVMLQYRFGTDAVLKSKKKIGFAFSAGYNLFFASSDGMGEGKFYFPSISPEINFTSKKYGLFKIRAYTQFGTKNYTRYTDTDTRYSKTQVPFVICIGICPNY